MATYREIEHLVLKHCGESARDALRRAVGDEANARPGRCSAQTLEDLEDAEASYAEDITMAFYSRHPLEPGEVLNHRRAALAWAFAQLLRRAGVKAEAFVV